MCILAITIIFKIGFYKIFYVLRVKSTLENSLRIMRIVIFAYVRPIIFLIIKNLGDSEISVTKMSKTIKRYCHCRSENLVFRYSECIYYGEFYSENRMAIKKILFLFKLIMK